MKTSTYTPLALCLVIVMTLLSAGCVEPGRMDQTLLGEYQRAMSVNRPAPTVGPDGMMLDRPRPDAPVLVIVEDPDTGIRQVRISLDEAVMRTLANSLDIAVASYDPEITRQEMIIAAAEFDYVLFAAFNYSHQDRQIEPRAISTPFIIPGITPPQLGTQTTVVETGGRVDTCAWEVGLRQRTITGAECSLSYTLTRTWDNLDTGTLSTTYEPVVALQLTQPLLRDAWPQFNLARLRIARINYRSSIAAFRQRVEEIVNEVYTTYYLLVQARRDFEIQRQLLAETDTTLEILRARIERDVPQMLINQTAAARAVRYASLIRAEKLLYDAQDRLARLIHEPELTAMGDYIIVPTTELTDVPVVLDPDDQFMTALRHNPQLEQARLAIAITDQNVIIARNQTLPRVDLVSSLSVQGLAGDPGDAHENLGTLDFASYAIGMTLEYPLGNRARNADLLRRRLEQSQSIVGMQNLADQVSVVVRERVRQVYTAWNELQAQRDAVEAARAQLESLEAALQDRRTPEFLQVTLQAQEQLANAARGALQALVDYNTALVDLARATGTTLDLPRVRIALPVAADISEYTMSEVLPPRPAIPTETPVLPPPPAPSARPGGKLRTAPAME